MVDPQNMDFVDFLSFVVQLSSTIVYGSLALSVVSGAIGWVFHLSLFLFLSVFLAGGVIAFTVVWWVAKHLKESASRDRS